MQFAVPEKARNIQTYSCKKKSDNELSVKFLNVLIFVNEFLVVRMVAAQNCGSNKNTEAEYCIQVDSVKPAERKKPPKTFKCQTERW